MKLKRSQLTKTLVYTSLLLSLSSIITSSKGWGEIYPFFHWKLFSQPSGSKHQDHVYRIYIEDSTSTLKRLPIESRATFTKDDVLYALSNFVGDTALGHQKLEALCRYLYPEHDKFYIYKETYSPLEILKNPKNYDTLFVTKIL